MSDPSGKAGNIYRTWVETYTGRNAPIKGLERKPDKYYLQNLYYDDDEWESGIIAYDVMVTISGRVDVGLSISGGATVSDNPELMGASASAGGGALGCGIGVGFTFIPDTESHWVANANSVTVGLSILGFGVDYVTYYDDEHSLGTVAFSFGIGKGLPFEIHAETQVLPWKHGG